MLGGRRFQPCTSPRHGPVLPHRLCRPDALVRRRPRQHLQRQIRAITLKRIDCGVSRPSLPAPETATVSATRRDQHLTAAPGVVLWLRDAVTGWQPVTAACATARLGHATSTSADEPGPARGVVMRAGPGEGQPPPWWSPAGGRAGPTVVEPGRGEGRPHRSGHITRGLLHTLTGRAWSASVPGPGCLPIPAGPQKPTVLLERGKGRSSVIVISSPWAPTSRPPSPAGSERAPLASGRVT